MRAEMPPPEKPLVGSKQKGNLPAVPAKSTALDTAKRRKPGGR